MKMRVLEEVEPVPVLMEGAEGAHVRVVLGREDRAPGFTMRVFALDAGGRTPYHRHDYEHEVYVLSGRGGILGVEGRSGLSPGAAVLVHPDEWHGFVADEGQPMEFLCVVPNRAYEEGKYRVQTGKWEPPQRPARQR